MRISDWSSDVCSSDLIEKVRPATASNILLWIIAAFVLIFIIWASVTELDRTVRGQGRVIPSSQLQVVSNLEGGIVEARSEEHTSELQSLMRTSYAVFCLKKKTKKPHHIDTYKQKTEC